MQNKNVLLTSTTEVVALRLSQNAETTHKIFQPHEIFNVTMKANATCIENVQNWLNDHKFDDIKYIAIGAK